MLFLVSDKGGFFYNSFDYRTVVTRVFNSKKMGYSIRLYIKLMVNRGENTFLDQYTGFNKFNLYFLVVLKLSKLVKCAIIFKKKEKEDFERKIIEKLWLKVIYEDESIFGK